MNVGTGVHPVPLFVFARPKLMPYFVSSRSGRLPGTDETGHLRRKNQPPMTRKFSSLRKLIRDAIFV